MPRNRTVELYRQFYTDMDLERGGLFESVRTRYDCRTALYPGCSFHITPSFYIPHVVYVDSSPAARDFFADQEALLQFIRRKKRYPESPFLRYIHQDFHLPLPLQLDNFDLLISIYAAGIAQDCKRYLKRGGILLTDNHHQEAAQARGAPDLEFIAVVNQKGRTYRISEEGLEDYFVLRKRGGRNPASSFSADPEYILTAEYYIFRRVAKKSEPA